MELLCSAIETKYPPLEIKLYFSSRVTMVAGNSGVGKTYLIKLLKELQRHGELEILRFIDYSTTDILTLLKSFDRCFVIIDDADQILDSTERNWIATDTANQYLLMGRNVAELSLGKRGLVELVLEGNVFKLRSVFS